MSQTTIFKFLKTGLHTTIQDAGRLGQQHLGIPTGGVLDHQAAQTANWLVGNPLDSPVLEITMMGPSIQIQAPCQIALTGAHLSPTLNQKRIKHYRTISIQKPSILNFGALKSGCRTYLAIRGTWQVRPWLSSYSAASTNSSQLTPDSVFKVNSQFMIVAPNFIEPRKIKKANRPVYNNHLHVRVLAGPEFKQFSKINIATFFSQIYTISNQSNRMGCRLEGRFLDADQRTELISSGIVPGTIQITHAGQPILLMKDAQTTGGYPRIATIIVEDLDKIAQLKPRDTLQFSLIQLKDIHPQNIM